MEPRFKVLLVGSGLMTTALLDYLISVKDTHITIGSNLLKEAQELVKKDPQRLRA